MSDVINITDLTFKYSDKIVLKDVNLTVPQNSIYGFLGLNGAGKTTLIKILLGLIKVEEGHIYVFGKDMSKERLSILKRVGSFVESPSLYPNLTACDYLKIKQVLLELPKTSIDWALEVVNLSDSKSRIIREFSLGMKQRLCIAFALLNDPELLILDEPTNGLDPSGIKDIRQLLKALQKQHNKTIFVSSHIIDEVEKVATNVGVLNKGSLVFEDTIENMASELGSVLRLGVHDHERSLMYLSEANYQAELCDSGFIEVKMSSLNDIININQILTEKRVGVYYLNGREKQLEDLFFELTKNN